MGSKRTFKDLFCELEQCPEAEFERTLFRRCVNRHAIPFAFFITRLNPTFFREDMEFLRDAGSATSTPEVVGEINRFYGRNLRDKNWLRRKFGIRVSGKRLLDLWQATTDLADETELSIAPHGPR